MIRRRDFLDLALSATIPHLSMAANRARPNVIFVLTDDQGYGDLSQTGNPDLDTPNIDSVARSGVEFTQFQVCPVCSPTRSGLLTGRYNYRTGIVDTFLGRSLMYPEEVTLAEVLRDAGYRTGIFGKWHLGDNYPMRAMDQGFEEALVIRGGGIGQVSDPPGSSYFDPILFHNGLQKRYSGYCTDVFFREATRWIEADRTKPYFAYIPTNAPHVPLQVADSLVKPFRAKGLPEETARVYGMVKNIDDNMGQLLATLKSLGQERDTIVIFMSDNGAFGAKRYSGGLRGAKTTPYQNGIQVPFFLRWPARLKAGVKVDRIAAQIDLFPTLLEACGVSKPANLKIDGRSLLALAEQKSPAWPDRMLFTQWHRGDRPIAFKNSAVRTQRYKLIDGKELYDMEADPGEKNDVAAAHPDVVLQLRAGYEAWFRDVSSDHNYIPPRIYLGTEHENPVVLTRQDWRVSPDPGADDIGWWEVDVKHAGTFNIVCTVEPSAAPQQATFELNHTLKTVPVAAGASQCRFEKVSLAAGPGRLQVTCHVDGHSAGAKFVEITRADH